MNNRSPTSGAMRTCGKSAADRYGYSLVLIALLVSLGAFQGCSRQQEVKPPTKATPGNTTKAAPPERGAIVATPLPKRASAGGMGFELVSPSHTKVQFVSEWDPKTVKASKGIGTTGAMSGVCIGDYDADGQPDLFLTRPFGGNRLYRNLGDFQFEDVTEAAGLSPELDYEAWGSGPTFVDIDNDGDLDLYVCSHRRANRLYLNQGDGSFVEKAKEYGLDFSGASVTMAFADYDLDGDLDAYLVTNRLIRNDTIRKGVNAKPRAGRMRVNKPFDEMFDAVNTGEGGFSMVQGAQLDHFYKNENGKFVDATEEVLGEYSAEENLFGHAARWFDYDNDGYPDLHVANDFFGPDQLFHNNGDGTMTDVAASTLSHMPWYSMGSDAGDVNNDGLLDLLASDMAFTTYYKSKVNLGDLSHSAWFLDLSNPKQQMTNSLYINTGTSRFIEAAAMAGVSNTDWTWAVKFADLDNDGWQDLYITNGMTRDWFNSDLRTQAWKVGENTEAGWDEVWKDEKPLREYNLAFKNRGNLRFEKVSAEWGLGFLGTSYGAALGDLDGDGDLDIVTINFEDPAHIYRNLESEQGRAVIELVGATSNRAGIGAVVKLEAGGVQQVRDLPCVRGFMSADEQKVFFGLGAAKTIDKLTIHWPSGVVQEFTGLPVDHAFTITEAGEPADDKSRQAGEPPLFQPVKRFPKVDHREAEFNDFEEQPLLPYRLSRLGPGIACGDVNADGWDDFYVSGARGQSGRLVMGLSHGLMEDFRSRNTWQKSVDAEEMAPLFFDADGDGDLDLYVVHGGNEAVAGDSTLQDRLYLNSGEGEFSAADDNALPDMTMSGSTVVAADFDHDGDLDLFVGGRLTPGAYPEIPRSVLLRNNGGVFEDATEELAPGLSAVGMVTGALWSDANGDGWADLLVTCEWGPVACWRNEQGRLIDVTADAGLADLTGWWNGIAGGDLDNDGDTDYVVTNLGLNTKYHASASEPAVIYYGDMDDDGQDDVVEGEYVEGVLMPVRGKTALTDAIPMLEEKAATYHEFASKSLAQLLGEDKLASARKLTANTLESGVLLNQGDGRLEFQPLPRIAQVSPGFGVVVFDANADGNQDVYLVQNFYSYNRETTRMDSGVSQLLLGDGTGALQAPAPGVQGIIAPGDAKGVAIADITHNARPDVLVTNNNGPLQAFENQPATSGRYLNVRLAGPPGNTTGIGAKVTVEGKDIAAQTFERHCGGGYLSQSSADLFVGLGDTEQPVVVTVLWPDGAKRQVVVSAEETRVTIKY